MSSIFNVSGDFFGLDIGTTAIRLVELRGSGTKSLVKYAYVPIEDKLSQSDSKADMQKVAKVVQQLVKQAGVATNNVAVGIPSSKVFTTVADIDNLGTNDLAKAIPLQADALIPTPLAESKIDWAVLGESPTDKTKKEVLLTSVANKFIEERLDMLESIGLNVVAFEPDNLAMARALAINDTTPQLLLDVGHRSTDLVVVMNGVPHLTRSIPTGVEAIVRSAIQNLNIDDKQAEQFVFKFGLSKDKLEGQVFQAISGTVDLLVSEIEKSIKFFETFASGGIKKIFTFFGATAEIAPHKIFISFIRAFFTEEVINFIFM